MKDDKRSGITPITYPTYNVRDAISELSRTKLKSSEFISEHNDGALGYQVGYMLGETKASLDLLPQDVAHEQTLNDILVHAAALKVKTHIGAGRIAQALGVYIKSAACYDAVFHKTLHTLVYGSTRHSTLGGYIFKRYTRVFGEDAENLLVQIINFVH